jgi:hypothetical protein
MFVKHPKRYAHFPFLVRSDFHARDLASSRWIQAGIKILSTNSPVKQRSSIRASMNPGPT